MILIIIFPAFVSIGGNVELKQNEIKRNEIIPMNHDYIIGDFDGNVAGDNPHDILRIE